MNTYSSKQKQKKLKNVHTVTAKKYGYMTEDTVQLKTPQSTEKKQSFT